jgi:hypothetical protein
MNCEVEYQAWMLLDQLGSHREAEERKRIIVDRTLQRIERATNGHPIAFRRVVDLSELPRVAGRAAKAIESPASGVKFA